MALACRYKFFWDIGIHVWYLEFDSGVKKGDSATFVASSSNEGTEDSSHCISKSEYDPVDTLKSNDSLSLRANSASQPSDLNYPMPWLCFSGFQIVLFSIQNWYFKRKIFKFCGKPKLLVIPRWNFSKCQSSKRESGSQAKAIRDRN